MTAERQTLLLSAIMAAVLGGVGVTFALYTGSRAILLDGLFNLTYFAVALVSVRVARLSLAPDNEEFPFGFAYFESLVNAAKGLLILGISVVALIDSLVAFATGGREILAGAAILYAGFATVACAATALAMRRAYRRHPTPLIRADLENWLVNTAVSGAVLMAFCGIPVVRAIGWHAVTPYVDPLLVTAVVLICLGVPIRMAWGAIMELIDRAPPTDIRQPVTRAIHAALADLPVRHTYIRMVRPGRTLFVTAHVVLPPDYPVTSLTSLDAIRQRVDDAVRQLQQRVVTDVLFTADPQRAAPTAGVRREGL